MKLSVVVPSRNRIRNLRNTLNALFNQSAPPESYEVILSDDGSSDGTHELTQEYRDRRFKYVFNTIKPHSWNASVPRNLGALVADPETTAYWFVDSDVVMPRHAVETYLEDLKQNAKRVIIGSYDFMDVDGTTVQIQDVRRANFDKAKPEDLFSGTGDALACFGGNLVIPRDIFYKTGGYDPQTHIGLEDGEYGLRLWKAGINFSYDNRVHGKHQWHEVPPDRFPPDMKSEHIDKLNLKHFGTKDPDYGIIEMSRDTYKEWGVSESWTPPPQWGKIGFMLKINKK